LLGLAKLSGFQLASSAEIITMPEGSNWDAEEDGVKRFHWRLRK